MTHLLRCRGSASEIAALFAARPDPALAWRPEIWQGEPVLAVLLEQGGARLRTMRWGLGSSGARRGKVQGTVFTRQLAARRSVRCLIAIEAFAYPDGPRGRRTRSWAGLWNEPIAAWAGICRSEDASLQCAGVLTIANGLIGRLSRHMPLLLRHDDRARWLDGAGLLSLASYEEPDYYLERTEERWSRGDLPPDGPD